MWKIKVRMLEENFSLLIEQFINLKQINFTCMQNQDFSIILKRSFYASNPLTSKCKTAQLRQVSQKYPRQ